MPDPTGRIRRGGPARRRPHQRLVAVPGPSRHVPDDRDTQDGRPPAEQFKSTSPLELTSWARASGFPVVAKPLASSSSDHVFICRTAPQVTAAARQTLQAHGMFGGGNCEALRSPSGAARGGLAVERALWAARGSGPPAGLVSTLNFLRARPNGAARPRHGVRVSSHAVSVRLRPPGSPTQAAGLTSSAPRQAPGRRLSGRAARSVRGGC